MYRPSGQQQQQQPPPDHLHQQQQQQHQQTEAAAFYDSFAATAFTGGVGYPHHHGLQQQQPHVGGMLGVPTGAHHLQQQHHGSTAMYSNTNTSHHHLQQQQDHGAAWASAAGLPDDDDPLLQRRLQHIVEQHKPSRNVLRELADVAEQQSTPSGKKRTRYDDEDDEDVQDDLDSDNDEDAARNVIARSPKKRRKRPSSNLHPMMMGQGIAANANSNTASLSAARKMMDEVIHKRNSVRFNIKNLRVQMEHTQGQLDGEQFQLEALQQIVEDTTENLVDDLLQDSTTWNQLYFALVEFYNEHGHLRVPWRKEGKERMRLGPWLVQQRKDYRRDPEDLERLEPYKIRALEKLNMQWEPFLQHWFNRFDELKQYKEEHGHCRVPYCSGRSTQSSTKKNKKRSGSDDGGATGDGDVGDETANNEDGLDVVLEEEDGDSSNPSSKIKYDSLGVWVKRQRNQYKNYQAGNKEKSGEMTEERIRLLESIGFEWSLRAVGTEAISWSDNFNALNAFKQEHGHTRVADQGSNKALAEWTKLMRNYMKKYDEASDNNALTSDHYQLLKDLELDSSLRESKFDARFGELMSFKKIHGHCLVPASYAANQKLSNWVQTQKRQYKLMKGGRKSQMTYVSSYLVSLLCCLVSFVSLTSLCFLFFDREEKCEMLRDAGFEFEVSKERKSEVMKKMDRSWDELFAELKLYKEKYGQINNIKQRKKKALREWCDEQRVQHARMKWGKDSTSTEEQIQKLTNLGFEWTAADTPSKGWDDYFGDLLAYFLKNQTFDVSKEEDEELQQWAETQQAEYKKYVDGVPSLLTKSRIKKLDDVSFPWFPEDSDDSGAKSNPDTSKVPPKNSWEEMFGQLLTFKINNKHFGVPKSMRELRKWTCQQRLDKLNHDTSKQIERRSAIWEERMHRLSEVGFDWLGDMPGKPDTKILPSTDGVAHLPGAKGAMPMMPPAMGTSSLMFSGAPNWASAAAAGNPFLANAAAGQLFMSAAAASTAAPSMGSVGKDLASQAAQIVAATNSRSKSKVVNLWATTTMAGIPAVVPLVTAPAPIAPAGQPVEIAPALSSSPAPSGALQRQPLTAKRDGVPLL
jgi:hypothetical protein